MGEKKKERGKRKKEKETYISGMRWPTHLNAYNTSWCVSVSVDSYRYTVTVFMYVVLTSDRVFKTWTGHGTTAHRETRKTMDMKFS